MGVSVIKAWVDAARAATSEPSEAAMPSTAVPAEEDDLLRPVEGPGPIEETVHTPVSSTGEAGGVS